MLKITECLSECESNFKMLGECMISCQGSTLEIRTHKALLKAQAKEYTAFLLHFGKGFGDIMVGDCSLKEEILRAVN